MAICADQTVNKTGPSEKSSAGRLRSLDVLRGVAVLMVLFHHARWPASYLQGSFGRFVHLGCYGVDLFFVLSGFLISGLLFHEFKREGRIDVVRFWLRRGMKIWPSYFVAYGIAVVVLTCIRIRQDKEVESWLFHMLPNLAFLQNYVWSEHRWFASWSLAVEEHFYTLLPLFLIVCISAGWGMRGVPWLCVATILVAPVLRYTETDTAVVYFQTHFRADALCCGVLLGYVFHYHQQVLAGVRRWWFVPMILPLVALAIPYNIAWEEPAMRVLGLSSLAVAFAGAVSLAVACPDWGGNVIAPVRWSVRLLAVVGVYSYTIYLAQPVVIALTDWYGPIPGLYRANRCFSFLIGRDIDVAGSLLFCVTSLAVGIVLSHLVERPCLALRERWIPGRRKGARSQIGVRGSTGFRGHNT
jgi:peptidoglycan/LPS O-acetylase OafA/YrhL